MCLPSLPSIVCGSNGPLSNHGSGLLESSLIGFQKLGELLDILATGTSATEVARLNTNTKDKTLKGKNVSDHDREA